METTVYFADRAVRFVAEAPADVPAEAVIDAAAGISRDKIPELSRNATWFMSWRIVPMRHSCGSLPISRRSKLLVAS